MVAGLSQLTAPRLSAFGPRVGRRTAETAFTGAEGVYKPRYASQRGALKPFEASAGNDFEVLVSHKSGYHPSSGGLRPGVAAGST